MEKYFQSVPCIFNFSVILYFVTLFEVLKGFFKTERYVNLEGIPQLHQLQYISHTKSTISNDISKSRILLERAGKAIRHNNSNKGRCWLDKTFGRNDTIS